jgi:hypothetical protein
MQKILSSVMFIFIATAVFTSCRKSDIQTYSGTDNIYFKTITASDISVMVDFSILPSTVTDTLLLVPVTAIGPTQKVDRLFKVVVSDSSTAKPGTHYDLLPDTFKIKAGAVKGNVALKLHRTADLSDTTKQPVAITLLLEPNENFQTVFPEYISNTTTGASVNKLQYTVFVTDVLTQPSRWDTQRMGSFSKKKIYLTASVTGVDITVLLNTLLGKNVPDNSLTSQTYWGRVMQLYLNGQKANGTPVLENDGTPMIMGTVSQ